MVKIKSIVPVITIILLVVNGIGAFYGGFQLITDPSGAKLQLPLSFLENSPFSSFLVPGIILLIVNGVFSIVVLVTLLLKTNNYPGFIIIQGILLTGWILVQVLMLRIFYPPMHLTFLVIGVCLIGFGLYLNKKCRE